MFLNSEMSYFYISKSGLQTSFTQVVSPSIVSQKLFSGDGSLGIGAAWLAMHALGKPSDIRGLNTVYLGTTASDEKINTERQTLQRKKDRQADRKTQIKNERTEDRKKKHINKQIKKYQ